MEKQVFSDELLAFLNGSPTPFHAVMSLKNLFEDAGFSELREGEAWSVIDGGKYYLTRNDSSIIAFIKGQENLADTGWHMVGAHTDSPCLRVKPNPTVEKKGYFQVGVEVYGGALLNPWFDRDLSLAGRVSYLDDSGSVRSVIINLKEPIAIIPSLAIHLDREANQGRSVNPQTDILPILSCTDEDTAADFDTFLLAILCEQGVNSAKKILSHELSFYDVQPPAYVGARKEFLASARLDNLLSCYIGAQSLIHSSGGGNKLLVCNDHEEVGSRSACGAQGPMLADFLERLQPESESRLRAISRSMMVSADNAHGVHPNYISKHDGNHGPILNKGPVIKVNANQSYATNSETAAWFKHCCDAVEVPVQTFVTRTDMGCGSTIGPITAAQVGVNTIDIGVPTFAMHSVRELAGDKDAFHLFQVLKQFYLAQLP